MAIAIASDTTPDSTAANAIASLSRRTVRHHVKLYLTGTSPAVRQALIAAGIRLPQATYGRRRPCSIGR
jgi:anti-anti-sigma regulatory factor